MADDNGKAQLPGPGQVSSSRPPSRGGGSRNNNTDRYSAFDRLSMGLPAHDEVPVPPVAGPSSVTGASPAPTNFRKSASTSRLSKKSHESKRPVENKTADSGDGAKPHRVSLQELEAVQGICEGENAPLREEIRELQRQIAELQPNDSDLQEQILQMKLDNLKFQQRQELQMQRMADQLPSAEVIRSLARDLGTVRQDHNSLMERSSRVHPQPIEDGTKQEDTGSEARIRELQQQLDALREATHARGRPNQVDQDSRRRDRVRREREVESPYSSDDDAAYYAPAYREDTDDPTAKIRFFEREKGPQYLSLRAERPSDPTFDRLMNYRYYRLLKRRATRDADAMIDGQRRLKALQRSLDSVPKFDGKDPIMVFAFLTRFTEEADLNGLTEAQALVALPRFLRDEASLAFQTAQSSGHSGGVNSWSEAVHFLLTSYATPSAMREAVIRVQEMKQKASEDEQAYNARLCQAIHRCGNVFTEPQRTTYFVNGLLPDIRSKVARFRESIPRHLVRYGAVVQYARDEGESVRANQASVRQVPRRQAPASQAHLLHEHGHEEPATSTPNPQGVFLMGAAAHSQTGTIPVSDNTSDLPSTQDGGQTRQEELYMVQAPRVPHSDHHTNRNRPGWKTSNPLVCFKCFAKNECIATNCTADPLDFARTVRNYEALTPQEQALAPNGVGTYQLAKRCLAASQATPEAPTGSKN